MQKMVQSWESFPGSSKLREWASDLRVACGAAVIESDVWDITGRAAVIISDELRSCRDAAHRIATDAGMRFVFVPKEAVNELTSPAEFLAMAPVLVHLESGRWMGDAVDGEADATTASMKTLQDQIVEWMRSFSPDKPVVFTTSAFTINDVAENFRHAGLFDRFLNLPAPTMAAYGNRVIDRIGRDHCADSVTCAPAKLGRLFKLEYSTECREELALLRLRRTASRLDRSLEFTDFVTIATRGFLEEDVRAEEPYDTRRQIAYHEAGHAAVSIIDSSGRNVPDYATIIPSASFRGIVVESYQYHADLNDEVTYTTFRERIRICLAGRAAEELVFGAEHVSNGSRSDLEKATGYSAVAFSTWGFAPSMEQEGQSGSNLKVSKLDGDPFTPSEAALVETLVQQFLAEEYREVKEMLSGNRAFVDAIAELLLKEAIVDQRALMKLAPSDAFWRRERG
jgi:hypothetical protein